MKLIRSNQTLSDSLVQILDNFSIDTSQPIEEIVRITQHLWLQKKRKQNIHEKTALDKQMRDLFVRVGMVNALYPTHKNYDYILLLGSDVPDMQARIAFLDELIKKGVTAFQLIVLSSDRPLYDYEMPYKNARSEQEMIQALLEKTDTQKWPKIFFCSAYGKTDSQGTHQRATTEDTVKAWLATYPRAGTCLVISQQPYSGRQHAVMEAYLKDGWSVETVGPQLAPDFKLEDMLDTLARWLYQEFRNIKN